ncbi:hypothetical protein GCM10007301_37160 [Azorhizobium oxalatiphilum]|uniref:Uncharacterized protein n=1 Tax=Azorhizobium oxalatiphilum TaxID=980631 RepID=A0A917FGJ7_9HYPH|nr:hypothetical protein [Azorhizobium oxalatiphilum]GGF73906.1 hypothetical protein GCM10007301_37160 [Azorhizobium oxalatiphilum]
MSDFSAPGETHAPVAHRAKSTEPHLTNATRQMALAEERTVQADTVRARKDECDDAESALGAAPLWLHWVMSLRLSWSRNRLSRAKNSAAAHRTIK